MIPVTGRPAGWCDLIVRQWPIDAVVGENGALAFYQKNQGVKRLYHPDVADASTHAKLDIVRQAILEAVPQSRVSQDQFARQFDLAIDFAEDEPRLGLDAAESIRKVFETHGAKAKISSIHVNGWFGNYDKLSMVLLLAKTLWQEHCDVVQERYLFCGDSPNDEPLFEAFAHSCGVANITPFVPSLAHTPTYICASNGGRGFKELVDIIISRRND